VVSVQLHDLAQVGHHLVAPTVVGNGQQQHVEVFVERKKQVPVIHSRDQVFLKRLYLRQLILARAAGDNAGRVRLQQRQQVIHITQVFFRHISHISAAAHLHGHQAFGGQHFEGFAQRGAADAQRLGNAQLVDPAARLQFARKNTLSQQFSDFFVQGARGEGLG